jgi:hypothetical protein
VEAVESVEQENRPAVGRSRGPDMRTFCLIWQRSNSVREVSEATGMGAASCMTRASKYRNLGADLKHFPRGRPRKRRRQEMADLNALLAAILQETREPKDDSVDIVREILEGIHNN